MIDLTQIFQAIIALFSVLITVLIIPIIKIKFKQDKQLDSEYEKLDLEYWIKVAVSAAEQIYKGAGQGEIRKNYVKTFLTKKGFAFDTASVTDSLNALIEAAVREITN